MNYRSTGSFLLNRICYAKMFSSIENFYRKHLTSKALCDIILKQCGYGGIGRRAWFRLRYVSVKSNFAFLISIFVEQLVISPPRSRVVPCKIFRLIIQADMAELADAHGSGPCERKFMQVQLLLSAPK